MKKKILFVNDEITVGGVSKVLNNLLNVIDLNKYDVSLLILHCHGDMLKDVPKGVKTIKGTKFFRVVDQSIGNLIKSCSFILLLEKLWIYLLLKLGLIEKVIIKERKKMKLDNYDVEIAFKEGFCSIFVASSDSKIKINWVHADYRVNNYAKNYMTYMKKILNEFTYNVAVSKVAAVSFKEVFDLKNDVIVIHNIIEEELIINKSKEAINYRDDRFTFISVGRLHPQKGYNRLVESAKQLKDVGYLFAIYIIGDGELEQSIKKQIEENKLNDTIILLGKKTNPYKYVKQADCFILSSLYEGLPTVVFESLILKVPVLSLEVAGILEQLDDKYGIVVKNNQEELSKLMKLVLDDHTLLNKYRDNLINYRYENTHIIKQVIDLIEGQYEQ